MEKICELKRSGKKKYYCYFELAFQIVGGKWKAIILYHLGGRSVLRFGEFKKVMPDISEKMLIQALRELEADGMVNRKVYKQVPPKVEYTLTELGRSIIPIILKLREWGVQYEQFTGLNDQFKDDDRYEQPNELPKLLCGQ